jgi:hypothetical protein
MTILLMLFSLFHLNQKKLKTGSMQFVNSNIIMVDCFTRKEK